METKKLAEWINKNAQTIILLSIVLTLILGLFMIRLEINNDLLRQVSPHSKIGQLPHYINETFGSVSPLIIVVEGEDIFTYSNLLTIRKLSRMIASIDGIERVISITEVSDLKTNENGIISDKLFGEEIPNDHTFLLHKKKYIESNYTFSGKLIAKDGKYALIFVTAEAGFRIDKLARDIKKQINTQNIQNKTRVYFGGTPSLLNTINDLISGDLKILVPFVVLVVLVILFLTFRTWQGVVLPLLSVFMATIIAIGFMGLAKLNLSMIGATIPVVLIAVGSAYGLHFLNKYYEEARLGITDSFLLVSISLRDVGRPILLAGITTFLGFVSLVFSDIKMIREFGWITSLGIILAMVLALIFIPAVLSKMKPSPKISGILGKNHHKFSQLAVSFARILIQKKVLILILFSISSIFCFTQFSKLRTEMDFLAFFGPQSEPVKVNRIITDNFGGFNVFSLYMKGEITDPNIEKLMVILEEKTRSLKKMAVLGGVQDMVAKLNYLWTGLYTIPETRGEIENLWFFMNGQAAMRNMVSSDKREALISFMIPSISREYIEEVFLPLQKILKPYREEIKIIPLNMTNEILIDLVSLMLYNQGIQSNLALSDNIRLKAQIRETGRELLSYQPAFPSKMVSSYLKSPECEISIPGNQIPVILIKLNNLHNLKEKDVERVLTQTLSPGSGYENDDILSLAQSIVFRYQEYLKIQRLHKAVKMLGSKWSEQDIQYHNLEYAISPLLWSSMPVGTDYKGQAQSIVRLESLEISGYGYLTALIKQRLFNNQIRSIIFAVLAVFILNAWIFRSLKHGLISIITILFTLIVNFGIMGLFHIPLDMVSITIASIAVGIGIDYSIHFSNRYYQECLRNGNNGESAIASTIASTGIGILSNAFAVGLGFFVLVFSSLRPIRILGAFLAFSMMISSLSSVTLLPILLEFLGLHQKKRSIP